MTKPGAFPTNHTPHYISSHKKAKLAQRLAIVSRLQRKAFKDRSGQLISLSLKKQNYQGIHATVRKPQQYTSSFTFFFFTFDALLRCALSYLLLTFNTESDKLHISLLFLARDLNIQQVCYRPLPAVRRPKGSLEMRKHFKGLGNICFYPLIQKEITKRTPNGVLFYSVF